jgi:quinolinate synthase
MAALCCAGHAPGARAVRARWMTNAPSRAQRSSACVRSSAVAREAENVDAAADLAAASIARAGEDVASRLKALMVLGRTRRASGEGVLPQERRNAMTRVMGCASASWIYVELDERGRTRASCASESDATAGYGALLCDVITGRAPGDVLGLDDSFVDAMQIGIGSKMEKSRANGFKNMLETAKKQLRALEAGASANSDPFPSLIVRADEVRARGSFAASQASYLEPDEGKVRALVDVLQAKKIGIVAHFYMDPEVQGVLMAAKASYPHIAISDSLVMADLAVKMVEQGCETIGVLGVDFMSENVRAIIDEAGHADAKVYRMAAEEIGCSLAEAAQSVSYDSYLDDAGNTANSVHVIYINTGLDTKAAANAKIPTITCTSSNVVSTVLQAAAQIPDVNVFYGPDTYMGGNLAELLRRMTTWDDEDIKALHPAHDRDTIKALLPRLRYFNDGTCMVHDMFGKDVCDTVRSYYGDAYQTAHFEVPGEMFKLAMEAKDRGLGVVGSTQNILDYTCARVDEAIERALPEGERLRFVLGTETGMVTSIVRAVQSRLRDAKAKGVANLEAEIVFPVSSDAITQTGEADVPVVPGPSAGEGCSLDGGCASCPYMKMNSYDALMKMCDKVGSPAGEAMLAAQEPRKYESADGAGPSIAAQGCVPILHMRHFQKNKTFSDALVADITSRRR